MLIVRVPVNRSGSLVMVCSAWVGIAVLSVCTATWTPIPGRHRTCRTGRQRQWV